MDKSKHAGFNLCFLQMTLLRFHLEFSSVTDTFDALVSFFRKHRKSPHTWPIRRREQREALTKRKRERRTDGMFTRVND